MDVRSSFARVCLLALLVLIPNRAAAAPILDQSVGADSTAVFGGANITGIAQTFTVGVEGFLSRVDLLLMRHGSDQAPLDVEIRRNLTDLTDASLLARISLDQSVVTLPFPGAWFSLDFSPFGLRVSPGEELAVVIRSAVPSVYGWGLTIGDVYAGGHGYFFQADRWNLGGGDQHLRTYVTPVPEPGLLALLAVGGLGYLGVRRKRSAAR